MKRGVRGEGEGEGEGRRWGERARGGDEGRDEFTSDQMKSFGKSLLKKFQWCFWEINWIYLED